MSLLLQGAGSSGAALSALTQVAGLSLWARPESFAALANNDPITSWPDSSGLAHNLTGAGGAARPACAKADLDGKDAAVFTPAQNDMLSAAYTLTQPHTLFMVAKIDTFAADAYFCDGAGLGDSMAVFLGATAGAAASAFGGAALSAGVAGTAYHFYDITFNGASSTVRRDGAVVSSGNIGTRSPGGFVMAARFGGAFWSASRFVEVAQFAGTMAAPDQESVRAWFRSRYPSLSIA